MSRTYVQATRENSLKFVVRGKVGLNFHYDKSWSSNKDLYGWSANGKGESKQTEKSRERSKIFTPSHVMTPLVDNDNIDFLT